MMNQTLDIKNAEKQVLRLATFEDGVWEIYLGVFFIVMSFYSITRQLLGPLLNVIFVLGMLLLLVGLAWIAKKRITQPRIGAVKLGTQSKKKIKTAHLITWALVLATFALVILSANAIIREPIWERLPQWFSDFDVDLIFALITIALFCLIGYYTGVARFYLYGVLLGVGNFATTVLLIYQDIQFGWPIALAGLTIALMGAVVLLKFLQTHPLPSQEVANGR
jgi:hypothetical protein